MQRSEALSALQTLVWNTVLLWPNPKAQFKTPRGLRRDARRSLRNGGLEYVCAHHSHRHQLASSPLPGTCPQSFCVSDTDIWENTFWKLENHPFGLVWWVLMCGAGHAFPDTTPCEWSFAILRWSCLETVNIPKPLTGDFHLNRVRWFLISPLIATCFLYNESVVWYWYFRAMQISYSPWNERTIDYSCLNPSTGMFAKGWFPTSKLSLHSLLGNPL